MSLASAHAAPPVVVRDLRKRFRGTTALDGISFEVASGEVTGLLGPNGAGKTTTLHILLGLTRPEGGTVRLFGRDPHDGTKAALARVAFASPEALMDWRLTIEENLRVYASLYGVPRSAVAQAIAALELRAQARTLFGDLSLGQQIRLGMSERLTRAPRRSFRSPASFRRRSGRGEVLSARRCRRGASS